MGTVEEQPSISGGASYRPPEPLNEGHDVSRFACGKPVLDDWVKRRALRSQGNTARTYVVTTGARVVAYYCVSAGSVQLKDMPRTQRSHGMPTQVPVVIIGRLAVDNDFKSQGLGQGLLKDAILRALNVAGEVGVRAILVHALDEEAARFYKKYGFVQSPVDERTYLLATETALGAL